MERLMTAGPPVRLRRLRLRHCHAPPLIEPAAAAAPAAATTAAAERTCGNSRSSGDEGRQGRIFLHGARAGQGGGATATAAAARASPERR